MNHEYAFFYLKLTILDFLHNLVVKLFVTKTYCAITWVRYVSFSCKTL